MEEKEFNTLQKKNSGNTVLGIVIGLLLAAVVGLGAYFVSKEFLNKDNKENGNVTTPVVTATPTPVSTPNNIKDKCVLTNFDKYELTADDKNQIANIVNNDSHIGQCEMDASSIKLVNSYGYYAHFSANTKCNGQDYDTIKILAYKVKDEFEVYTFGSGWLNTDEENLKKILESMCK